MRIHSSVVVAAMGILWSATALRADLVQDAVNLVSQSSYTQYLAGNDFLYTHNGNSRGIGAAQHDLAQQNIQNTFGSFGLTTSLYSFTYGGSTYYDVVAVKPGAVTPQNIYIVGSHYDSVGNPGADDNASGTAGILEAARVLSQGTFDSTVVFIAFDREEQGLVGSHAYADAHAGDNILGMVSMDMIAWNDPGAPDTAFIYSNAAGFKSLLASAMSTYGGLNVVQNAGISGSDDYYFGVNGKPSGLLIESYYNNPNYHKATDSVDTLGYIDYAYATDMTRGVVGYVASEAGISAIPEPGSMLLLLCGLLMLRARRGRAV